MQHAGGQSAQAVASAATAGETTILFTDIEGSSELVERFGDREWLEVLRLHNAIMRREIERFRGFEVKTVGDGFMVAFSSPQRAVECAAAVQHALAAHAERNPDVAVRVRMGLHCGDTVVEENDFFGKDVVTAARISARAAGGEILISERVRGLISGIELDGGTPFRLKGLEGPQLLYQVLWGAQQAGPPAARSGLVERDEEFAQLEAAIERTVRGGQGAVLLEGPAGMGKSALAAAAAGLARDRGLTVLEARGSELERPHGFGLVRQLLQPTVDRLPADARASLFGAEPGPAAALLGAGGTGAAFAAGDDDAAPHATLADLTAVVGRLAERHPMVLVLDDVQWADDASLAWATSFVRGEESTPVLLLATLRSDEPARPAGIDALAAASRRIGLEPLSTNGCSEAVRARLPGAGERFAQACRDASGGNPFFLVTLLDEIVAAGVEPTDANAGLVGEAGPEAIGRMVVGRLRRLTPAARALAEACAVLQREAALGPAARLAALKPDEAIRAADELCDAGILRARSPLDFEHPIVRRAVERELPRTRRSELHRAAARLLSDEERPAQEIASHLLQVEPADDPWVVEALLAASAEAAGDGTPQAAAEYLQRAVAEPPGSQLAAEVQARLGSALLDAGDPAQAEQRLRRAVRLSQDARSRAAAVVMLARALDAYMWAESSRERWDQHGPRLLGLIDDCVAALCPEDRELRYEIEAQRQMVINGAEQMLGVAASPERSAQLQALVADATGGTPGERALIGEYVIMEALRGTRPAHDLLSVAAKALEDGQLVRELAGEAHCEGAIEVHVACDQHAVAELHLDEAARHSRRRGSRRAIGYISQLRAANAWLAGSLAAAEGHAADARRVAATVPSDEFLGFLIECVRVACALARGEHGAAADACAAISHRRLRHHADGLVSLAAGRCAEAIPDLEQAQEILEGRGLWRTVGPFRPVRPDLAIALAGAGRAGDAATVAEAELEIAERSGVASTIANARRALGIAAGGEAGVEHLRAAEAAATPCEARLVHAQILLDLGLALGQAGSPEAASALGRAAEIAERHEAAAIAVPARAALAR